MSTRTALSFEEGVENITFDFNIPWRISQQGFIEVESLRLEWDRGLGASFLFFRGHNLLLELS